MTTASGVIEGFADYPWRGTKTKQFDQVGNAFPPLLAAVCMAEAMGLTASATNQNIETKGA